MIQFSTIRLPDFEISWAGENPWNGGLCFGSDDGRLKTTNLGNTQGPPITRVAESGEAINGVAFSGSRMAVSTRSEVVLIDLGRPGSQQGTRTVFDGGAHHVIATTAGGFLAPLGVDGLLMTICEPGPVQLWKAFRLRERATNLYKLAHLQNNRFICAARHDGCLVITLSPDGPVNNRNFRASGLDVVDVCSLGSTQYPFRAAYLGADCSLYLSRDVLNGPPPQTLRFNKLRGVAYSLLCSQERLFLVTSEAIYVFPDLASTYLSGNYVGSPTRVKEIPLKAVDAYIAYDRLLIVMPDMAMMASVGELAGGVEIGGTSTSIWEAPKLSETDWEISPCSELTFASIA
jgi:hypothetical protein